MKNLSLTFKIIIIFLIPAIAITYFSFYFIESKYSDLHESLKYKLSANITNSLSLLTHAIQLERGLSAGYIVAPNNKNLKISLQSQYKSTDKAYQELLEYIALHSEAKESIVKEIGYKNKPYIKKVIYEFSSINEVRERILNSTMIFEDEIKYYSKITRYLLDSMESLIIILKKQSNDDIALSKLQNLKEDAGLERAYIYNHLLANKLKNENIETIKNLQYSQNIEYKEFMLSASIESTLIYSQILKKNIITEVQTLREKFFKDKLNTQSAIEWFKVSTYRIDKLEEISSKILDRYINNANEIHSKTLISLYITAILWVFSIISLIILTYILKKLIRNEEHYTEELRISAYTFDSHEAMTITDVNGTILKVNNGFTRITGYSPQEVIGQNPRVLKSMKHDEEFYKEMWRKIHTEGKWSDEIYNMRKNGEVYLERLSITAIKNEMDVTTHYIAQFLDISDLKHAQEKAEHQADHDFLTGLANRKHLMQRLHEEFIKARRHDFLHAFLFIDLDNFKKVNDTYGHSIGDLLIKKVADTLKSLIREEDFIARISGDEFAIMLLNINEDERLAAKDVKEISNKILTSIAAPLIINEHKLEISSSIGIKLFPDGEKSIQNVIIHADTAMYQAKNQGKINLSSLIRLLNLN